jgi:alpha-L-fucosidase 2
MIMRSLLDRRPRGAFAAAISLLAITATALAGGQTAAPVQFAGEASPPASPLSLWYRQPASDHPLETPRPRGRGADAEWVRALPVGNGRLGAMVFGGVVHERLQLNEDTLWAGRPYDPVNPHAKDALPEVRRLLAAGQYADAAKLVSQKVMARPLAQMPYQTLGDLTLTFPEATAVEGYRRDLDVASAVAHVTYTTGGVAFTRDVFASAPDDVIVVRLTASRPGRISFQARVQTPPVV